MDTRRRDLDTIKRLAEWLTKVENEGEWVSRSTGERFGRGPVVELEMGYRTACYWIHSDFTRKEN